MEQYNILSTMMQESCCRQVNILTAQDIVRGMEYISGDIWTSDGILNGYVAMENGRIAEIGEGTCPEHPVCSGLIVPAPVNAHTHIGDAGLCLDRKYSLEELVAPPDGVKHTYLSKTPRKDLVNNMSSFSERLRTGGFSSFIDFSEGGAKGCRMLREASRNAVILGRPVSEPFDEKEAEDILRIADGMGISGMRDMSYRYLEKLADATHRAGGIFAVHASECRRDDIDAVLALEPDFLVHMCSSDKGDLRKCADADVTVVVCARSNLYFGLVPPIKDMLDAGVRVAVGTDNAMICSADSGAELDTFTDVLISQGGKRLDAVRCLTEGGKKILNDGANIGLKAGAEADISVYRVGSHGTEVVRFSPGL